MKDFEITLKGKKYSCRITLRAMLKFKQVTGRDWGQLEGNGVSDMIVFLWCCVWATSMTDGVDFPHDLDEFAGNLDGGVFGEWTAYMTELNSTTEHKDDGGKKSSTIEELIAFGTIEAGLSRDDVLSMSFREFEAVQAVYADKRERDSYDRWDRLRTLAAILIQPHVKRKISPSKLLPLPWDDKGRTRSSSKAEVARSTKEVFERLVANN